LFLSFGRFSDDNNCGAWAVRRIRVYSQRLRYLVVRVAEASGHHFVPLIHARNVRMLALICVMMTRSPRSPVIAPGITSGP